MLNAIRGVIRRHPLPWAVVATVLVMAAFYLMSSAMPSGGGIVGLIVVRAVMTALVFGFIVLVAGWDTLRPSLADMRYAARKGAYLIGMIVVLCGMTIASQVATGGRLVGGWLVNLCAVAVLCLLVGTFEEGVFRGILLNGLLARMGGTHGGMIGAAVVSALAFGVVHVCEELLDASGMTALMWGQFFGKIVTVGMLGFLFAAIYMRTRNLWTVIALHAFNDFMLLGVVLSFGESAPAGYVFDDVAMGGMVLIAYLVYAAVSAPFVGVGLDVIKSVTVPCRGLFSDDAAKGFPAVASVPQVSPPPVIDEAALVPPPAPSVEPLPSSLVPPIPKGPGGT